jgi:hypothetical protein
MTDQPDGTLPDTTRRYVASIYSRSGARLYFSAPHSSRQDAAREAFSTRHRVHDCSTCEAHPETGMPTHFGIEFHRRRDVIARAAMPGR